MKYKFFYALLILFNVSAIAFDPVVLDDEKLASGINRQVWHTAIDTLTTTRTPVVFGNFKDARVVLHPAKAIKNPAHIEVTSGPTTLYAIMHHPETSKSGLFKVNLTHQYLVKTSSRDLTEISTAVEVFIRFAHALAFNTQQPNSPIILYTREENITLSDQLGEVTKNTMVAYVNTSSSIFITVPSEHGRGKKVLQWTLSPPMDVSLALSPAVSYFTRRDAAIVEEQLRRAEAVHQAKLHKEEAERQARIREEQRLHEEKIAKEKADEEARIREEQRLHEAKIAREKAETAARAREEQRLHKERIAKEKAEAIQSMLGSIKTPHRGPRKDFDTALTDFLTSGGTPPTMWGDTLEDVTAFQQALEPVLALHGALGNPFEYGVDQQLAALKRDHVNITSTLSALQDAIEKYQKAREDEDKAYKRIDQDRAYLAKTERAYNTSNVHFDVWINRSFAEYRIENRHFVGRDFARKVSDASDALAKLKARISSQAQSNEDLLSSLRARSEALHLEIGRVQQTAPMPYLYHMDQYRIHYQEALKLLEDALQKGTLPKYRVLETMAENLDKYIQASRTPFKFTPAEISIAARGLNGRESKDVYVRFVRSTQGYNPPPPSQVLASFSTQLDFLPTLLHIMKGAGEYSAHTHWPKPRYTLEALANVTPDEIVQWFSRELRVDPLEAGLLKY